MSWARVFVGKIRYFPENPTPTFDAGCTVALFIMIRTHEEHTPSKKIKKILKKYEKTLDKFF